MAFNRFSIRFFRVFVPTRTILPGFYFTLSITLCTLFCIVVLPVAMLTLDALQLSWAQMWEVITSERVLKAIWVTIRSSLIAACINGVFGLWVSWVLVRYRFFGRNVLDALIDIPFALPTAVAGIALASLYHPQGWIGQWLDRCGISVLHTSKGIVIAMIYVGLPFVVRMVQPVLQELGKELEEAAYSLGARPAQCFQRVIFPQLMPALLSGVSLAFARGLGEFGSIIFIAGNLPYVSEVVSLLIMTNLEQHDYAAATMVAMFTLVLSMAMMFLLHRHIRKLSH